MSLSERELQIRQRLKDDYCHYAPRALKIRAKNGEVIPFFLNKSQEHIHERLEEQKRRTGMVRALVLKGRQQGCSTYIGGRFYHRASHSKGVRVFILTHEDAATQNLFEMVVRYHENCPALVKPQTGAANAKELNFSQLDSGYKVGTAGTKGVGRSSTIQLFHGSEVAFWPHADTHAAGVLQAVPNEPGTEVVLESTANGLGNFFHKKWREAESGESEYIAIFVPWFWQPEYRAPKPDEFIPTAEEDEYQQIYGLDIEQIVWRRNKIRELQDPLLFKQEYPATAAEAFQMTGHDSYIAPELILRARKNTVEPSGPLIIGFDPAWMGDDRSALARRRGRCLINVESKSKVDTMGAAGWLNAVIKSERPDRVFIDVGGIGAGVYDRLKEMGHGGIVRPVNFGSRPFSPPANDRGGPANRRAEMWMLSKQWLEDEAGVSIPDSDEIQQDACGPSYGFNSNSELLLESKAQMRKRGIASPDAWDAVALTFAEPVGYGNLNIDTMAGLHIPLMSNDGWMAS